MRFILRGAALCRSVVRVVHFARLGSLFIRCSVIHILSVRTRDGGCGSNAFAFRLFLCIDGIFESGFRNSENAIYDKSILLDAFAQLLKMWEMIGEGNSMTLRKIVEIAFRKINTSIGVDSANKIFL